MALRFTKANKDPADDEYLIYEEVDALLADGTAGKVLQPIRSVSVNGLKTEMEELQKQIESRKELVGEIETGTPLPYSLPELLEK
jgi:hypothetical protein